MKIAIASVSKRFGGTDALRDVSLDIEPGRVVTLVGANGAGKTTLLRLLATLYVPDAGQILFDGELLQRGRIDLRRRLHFLPDFPVALNEMTVIQHLAMAVRLYDGLRPGLEERVMELLRDFDLLPLAEVEISKLSRGELYKTALVALLTVDPELWLLDEPFVLIGLAVRGYRRGITIQEVMVRSDGSLRAVYRSPAPRGAEILEGAVSPAKSPIDIASLREVLLSPTPRQADILGRIWRRWISDRDEAILVAIRWPRAITTRNWLRWAFGTIILSYAVMSLFLLGGPIFQRPPPKDLAKMIFMFSTFAIMAFVSAQTTAPTIRIAPGQPQKADQHRGAWRPAKTRLNRSRSLHVYFPVGAGEITPAILKSSLFKFVCWAPLAVALSGIGVAVAEMPVGDAVLSAAVPGLCVLSEMGVAVCLNLSGRTNDNRRLGVWAAWLITILLALFSYLALFFILPSAWTILALLVLAGSSWGFWWYYVRRYEWGNIDIVR